MMMRADRHNDANNPRPSGTLMMIASLLSVMQLWSEINRRVDLTCDLRVGDARGVTSLRMVHQTTTSTT